MQITTNLTPVNHDSGRAAHPITGIVLHTMVGSTGSARSRFFNPAAQVSANYLVSLDGSISLCVRESDTAWCNGNYQSNLTSISIEHEDNGDYNGPRTPQLYEASAELVADICRRYNIPCDRNHIKGHNEVIDKSRYPGGTACPDGLEMDRIIARANELLHPAQPAVNQPLPSATGETVTLPADNTSWRLYPTDRLPVVGNEKAVLNPSQFNGLTYAVLGHPYPNVVTIQTQMFGVGNIWVGSDTNAHISAAPTPPAVSPAIVPAVPDKAPTTAKSTYTRFEKPLNLKAKNQPTNAYSLDGGSWSVLNNAIVKQLNQGDPFVAVGKAKHPLGGVYYMTAYSFGRADETGTPDHNYGINTVDLVLEVPPAPVEASQPPLVITDNTVTPPAVTPEPVVAPTPVVSAPESEAQKVEVKVIPVDPEAWKHSLDTSVAGRYRAQASVIVRDLEGMRPEHQLVAGKVYEIGGKIVGPDKLTYYMTPTSITNRTFFGIPKASLEVSSLNSDLEENEDLLNLDIARELHDDLAKARNGFSLKAKALEKMAKKDAEHLLDRFRHKK